MKSNQDKALDLLAERLETAAMNFAIEVYRATGDMRRVASGEEPFYPADSSAFISREKGKQEYFEGQRKNRKLTKKA